MTQSTNLTTVNQYLGDDIGALQAGYDALATRVGDNANLSTTQKATLVGAINENKSALTALQNQVSSLPTPESEIDDAVTATDKTWSSSKISTKMATDIAALKQDLLGGVGADYDTFQELLTFIQQNGSDIAALTGSFVSFTTAQSLTAAQQSQARTNITAASQAEMDTMNAFKTAVGDPSVDYAAIYEARRVAAGGPAITRV